MLQIVVCMNGNTSSDCMMLFNNVILVSDSTDENVFKGNTIHLSRCDLCLWDLTVTASYKL